MSPAWWALSGAAVTIAIVGLSAWAHRTIPKRVRAYVLSRITVWDEGQRQYEVGAYRLKADLKNHKTWGDEWHASLQKDINTLKAQFDARNAAADEAFQNIGADMGALAAERGKDRESLDALASVLRQQTHAIAGVRAEVDLVRAQVHHINEGLASKAKKPATRKRAR